MRHPVDLIGGLILRYGPAPPFFDGGWGDEEAVEGFDLPTGDPVPPTISWGARRRGDGLVLVDGWFRSRAPLPERARTAGVRLVEPKGGAAGVVVLLAAWNDQGYGTRMRLARRLATRGRASLLLEQPFYGLRNPYPHRRQPIRTVADFVRMGYAAVVEARDLLAGLRDQGPGVAGYSMGGNLAALASATSPFPVATAVLAGPYSPAPVYLDGVLRAGIAWEALGGRHRAERRLRRIMLRASALRVPAPAHARTAVIVAPRHDAYVPATAVEALHRHWRGSELRRVGGGHATALWLRKGSLAAAVDDALDRTFRNRA